MSYRFRSILIALALAIVAAMLVTFYVASYKKRVQHQQTTVPVVVAAKDIDVGATAADILAHNELKVVEMPLKSVVPGHLANPVQIGGEVVTAPIYAGEQVTLHRFGKVAPTGIRSQLKGNLRAIQVSSDQNSLLTGTLQAGDKVDVVTSVKYKVRQVDAQRLAAATAGGRGAAGSSAQSSSSSDNSSDEDRAATRTILHNILVLQTSDGGGGGKLSSGPNNNPWVMLAVTDAQAQKLYWVMENAQFALTLRPVTGATDSPNSLETVGTVLTDGMSLRETLRLWGL
jgi:Flp pilus assembly protein CpaB